MDPINESDSSLNVSDD